MEAPCAAPAVSGPAPWAAHRSRRRAGGTRPFARLARTVSIGTDILLSRGPPASGPCTQCACPPYASPLPNFFPRFQPKKKSPSRFRGRQRGLKLLPSSIQATTAASSTTPSCHPARRLPPAARPAPCRPPSTVVSERRPRKTMEVIDPESSGTSGLTNEVSGRLSFFARDDRGPKDDSSASALPTPNKVRAAAPARALSGPLPPTGRQCLPVDLPPSLLRGDRGHARARGRTGGRCRDGRGACACACGRAGRASRAH